MSLICDDFHNSGIVMAMPKGVNGILLIFSVICSQFG
jgi:hypothetical protein